MHEVGHSRLAPSKCHPLPMEGGYKCLPGVSVLPHQCLSCGRLVFVAPTVQPLGAPGDCCPDPLCPSPESYKCPVSPGAVPSPQQALALQLPTCKILAVMAAFARHCMDNPGCLSLHHGGDTLATSAGQGCSRSRKLSPKAQRTLSILCHLLTHSAALKHQLLPSPRQERRGQASE